MTRVFLVTVRFHEGRYHGMGDWPPSPARLFQALVAGIGQGGPLGIQESEPLVWLETISHQSPPIIAVPVMNEKGGQAVNYYVPNNDLDAVGGDARRIGSIRTKKVSKPKLFDQEIPFLYAWNFDGEEESNRLADRVCEIANSLYQLGRGIDQAWACGEVIVPERLDALLADYRGEIYRPTRGGNGRSLACPQTGSLDSLKTRFAAMGQRFKTEEEGNSVTQRFSQAPKPRFMQVSYESPPQRRIYALRPRDNDTVFVQWPLSKASELVVSIRNGSVARLKKASLDENQIEKCIVGRKANGDHDAPKSARVRIVPLPSIGHHHVDRAIRRVFIEVPAGCLIRADDVYWSFSGLELFDPETKDNLEVVLTPTDDDAMLEHYGAKDSFLVWRTITPMALPEVAKRRRIEPSRRTSEAKSGTERAAEQTRAAASVLQALRHAEILTQVDTIRVQREPFEGQGERAETFAPGTRFAKERLWHIEITFAESVSGPLVIGDGRYLGLGIMTPLKGR